MRPLMVVLALVAVTCGGCAADPKVAYLAAYATFRDAVWASAVEGKPIPIFASEVGQAASRFTGALKVITFPLAATASADILIKEAAILDQQCSIASTATDPAALSVALQGVTEQARKVTNASVVVAKDLGIAEDLGIAPAYNTSAGSSSVAIPRSDSCGARNGWSCESLVGDVATDALRATDGADFALVNSGAIRAGLTCPAGDSPTDFCPSFAPPPYPITRGQVNAALPFGDITVVATIDGAKLLAMLENGVSQMPTLDFRFPQVSGLCFSYDIEAPAGSRVTGAVRQAADGSCTGAAIDLTAATSYTLATSDYVAAGGDSYPVITGGVTYGFPDQHVADWLTAAGTISPVLQGRITCTDPNPGSGSDCPVIVR